MDDTRYSITGPDVVFEEFDGDLVVLHLGTGRYSGFDAGAAAIWDALLAGHGKTEIARALADAALLDPVLETLTAQALIVADPHRDAPGAMAPALAARLAAATGPARVTTYDDLSDLIVSDPIHESDEQAGWPVRRAE